MDLNLTQFDNLPFVARLHFAFCGDSQCGIGESVDVDLYIYTHIHVHIYAFYIYIYIGCQDG